MKFYFDGDDNSMRIEFWLNKHFIRFGVVKWLSEEQSRNHISYSIDYYYTVNYGEVYMHRKFEREMRSKENSKHVDWCANWMFPYQNHAKYE